MTHTSPPAIAPERGHALVTGGGTGIGAAIAQALVAQGLNVTVLDGAPSHSTPWWPPHPITSTPCWPM